MVQSILFFALGFLCAAFLALIIVPAVWRRAVLLTRRRVEASVPLTLNEIQADKDKLRAEFAMSTRRLEMSVKEFKDRATSQIVEINRNREEMKRLAAARDEQSRTIAGLESRAAEMSGALGGREDELARLTKRFEEKSQALKDCQHEIDRLGKLYEEASFASSSRQIELVARESELEKLSGDISELKAARKEAERRAREVIAEARAAQDTLRVEKKKAAELEKRLERLTTVIADRDKKLDLREKELARLREDVKVGDRSESGAGERQRIKAEIEQLLRENRELKDQLAARQKLQSRDLNDEERVTGQLREQMNDLAAQVLNLTAMLDDPSSPIARALEGAGPANSDGIMSLAERVRALRRAASSQKDAISD